LTCIANLSCVSLNIRVNKVCDEPKYFEAYRNDKFAAIFKAGHECFLQVAPVLFYKMDAKNTA
jgi:hypothetical protein